MLRYCHNNLFVLITYCVLLLFSTNSSAQLFIGDTLPEFKMGTWINSKPLTLKDLKGKVVLIRWWTGPSCPFCSVSSIALNEWYEKYKNQDFMVIGVYHHKSSSPFSTSQVEEYAKYFNFTFPVAIDNDWKVLKAWWLTNKKNWTSVSFLVDRNSKVQHIHSGGSYVNGDQDYQKMQMQIEKLLNIH